MLWAMARHTREFWERVVAAVDAGGSHAAVAGRFDVTVGALRSWVYKLRHERVTTPSVSLLPVSVRGASGALEVDCGALRLRFVAGAE